MSSPYINTQLSTNVPLFSSQMNNKIYLNLKNNLVNNLEKMCYKNFGYIMEIHKILKYKDGMIEPENTNSAANFDVLFSCRLCIPREGIQIICQVDRVNKLLITAKNGPLLVIITSAKINDKTFFTDNNDSLRYRSDKSKSEMLKANDFVKVTLGTVMYSDGDDKIKATGFLDDIATEKETAFYYKDLYDQEKAPVSMKDMKDMKDMKS